MFKKKNDDKNTDLRKGRCGHLLGIDQGRRPWQQLKQRDFGGRGRKGNEDKKKDKKIEKEEEERANKQKKILAARAFSAKTDAHLTD